jgi:GNAT superfamily N-acetyltransferase
MIFHSDWMTSNDRVLYTFATLGWRRHLRLTATLRTDPFPSDAEMHALSQTAWGDGAAETGYAPILSRSLAHVGAYDGERLIGFVNVAWDGGIHAFILDTAVHPDFRRQGIATRLVKEAEALARKRGARWLHVDFEPHLEAFYQGCGFRPTNAGLIDLRAAQE